MKKAMFVSMMIWAVAASALAKCPPTQFRLVYDPFWSAGSNRTWVDGDQIANVSMDTAWQGMPSLQVGGGFTSTFPDPWVNVAPKTWYNRVTVMLTLPSGSKTTVMNAWVWRMPAVAGLYCLRVNYKITHISTVQGHTTKNVKKFHVTYVAAGQIAPLAEPTPPGFTGSSFLLVR